MLRSLHLIYSIISNTYIRPFSTPVFCISILIIFIISSVYGDEMIRIKNIEQILFVIYRKEPKPGIIFTNSKQIRYSFVNKLHFFYTNYVLCCILQIFCIDNCSFLMTCETSLSFKCRYVCNDMSLILFSHLKYNLKQSLLRFITFFVMIYQNL